VAPVIRLALVGVLVLVAGCVPDETVLPFDMTAPPPDALAPLGQGELCAAVGTIGPCASGLICCSVDCNGDLGPCFDVAAYCQPTCPAGHAY
jgi:hypothetical protein